MIIYISADGACVLQDPHNFKEFNVASALADTNKLGIVLGSAGKFDGEHAWISKEWLGHQIGSDARHLADFEKMCAYAASKGWMKDDFIRAHVEGV